MDRVFRTMETYRDQDTSKQDQIFFDEETIVEGLKAFGVQPLFSETDGSKLKIYFVKSEALPVYQRMQNALSGIGDKDDPAMNFFVSMVLARQAWRASLAMMRNFKDGTKYVQ